MEKISKFATEIRGQSSMKKNMNKMVGANLKMLREASGFTQDQVASSIGIERSAYSNYETGIRELSFHLLEKLSNLFGCETHLLFETHLNKNEILLCAFRGDDLSASDLKGILYFKDIVRSYIKLDRLTHEQGEH